MRLPSPHRLAERAACTRVGCAAAVEPARRGRLRDRAGAAGSGLIPHRAGGSDVADTLALVA